GVAPRSAAGMRGGATYCGSPAWVSATSRPGCWPLALLACSTTASGSAWDSSPPMRTSLTDSRPLRLAALGDLMLAGEWDIVSRRRGEGAAFAALRAAIEDADLVFANLETTVEAGGGHIPKEPPRLGRPESMRRSLAAIGVGVVNLANNHAFDGDLAGFEAVRRLLEEEGIAYFGAGRDAREAGCPLVLERGGLRLGWLGYVALDTRPSHVAGPGTPGVNPLEAARAFADVARLAADVDHVLVS